MRLHISASRLALYLSPLMQYGQLTLPIKGVRTFALNLSEHNSRTPIEGYRARYKPIAKTRHCVFTRLRDIRDASRADWLRPGNCNCLQAQPNLQRMLKESLWILDRYALLFLVFFLLYWESTGLSSIIMVYYIAIIFASGGQ